MELVVKVKGNKAYTDYKGFRILVTSKPSGIKVKVYSTKFETFTSYGTTIKEAIQVAIKAIDGE